MRRRHFLALPALAEFEEVLRGGLTGGSTGVMMFTLPAVAEDPVKLAVLKKVYRGRAA